MTKAMVLGATGHIGAHVVRALLGRGHEVRAAYRSEKYLSVLEGLPVERVKVNLDRPEELREALRGCSWVFHAAGYYPSNRPSRAEAIRAGIESARRDLEEIRRAGPERVVFTSSAATFIESNSIYTAVKIAMEQEALRAAGAGLPVVIVNPSLCIGEYDAHAFSGRSVLAFAKYRLGWYTSTSFNVVYTGDVGVGHVRAAEAGRVGERYLLAGQNISLKEFGTLACRELGLPPPRWKIPLAAVYLAACGVELFAAVTGREPLFTREEARRIRVGYRLDGSKVVRELGTPQTPPAEAIRRAVEWFKQQGYLKESP
ncbi:MAG: NAD-dependent epimerase/dehydratase family protein [Candidatus Omnitrophota bacterium]|nr:NAD-dependent epimerase/dehydratase family protein [Candidatus Omnitrophota bacterium]